jgi:uncharacterized Ntn-hydrolase superfamily protein
VGVASKFLGVGGVVNWAQAGAGAVATQAFCKVSFGREGLALMAAGKSAQDTLNTLLEGDPKRENRQVGVIDRNGNAAAHTGKNCYDWAGHVVGEGFSCQGNILAGQQVVAAMAEAYKVASGELADRLVAALLAGDDAGGDRRGKQGAGVLVVKEGGGYGGDTDRYLDARVDDDPEPVKRLQRLVKDHHLFFGRPRPEDLTLITPAIASQIQNWLLAKGYSKQLATGTWDDASKKAFWAMVGSENLEERWNLDGNTNMIDQVALDYLQERFGK